MKKNLLKSIILAAAVMPIGAWAQTSTSRLNFEGMEATTPYKTVSLDDGNGFKVVAESDRDESAIDGNNINFAYSVDDESAEWSPTKRWKPATGLNKSGRSMTITVPSAGKLNLYVRNSSGSDATRTITLTKSGTQLYSEVVKDADAFNLTSNNAKCFPIISIDVPAAGDIAVVTSGGINFYGFSFTPPPATSAEVTITAAKYATFANNTVGTLALPTGLKAYGVSAVDAGTVAFTEYNVIPAGVGVILSGDAGDYTLDPTDTECTYEGDNLLVAVTADMTVPAKAGGKINYLFANGNNGVGFYKSSGNGTVSKGKAYLSITDESADNRTWDFTASKIWSDATIANLEVERPLETNWKSNAESTVDEVTYYRYMNYSISKTEAAELSANGVKIAETAGLLFRGNTNRVGIDNRAPNHFYFAGNNVYVVIPDLKAGSTVTISTKSSGSGTNYAYLTCADTENVGRSGSTEALEVDNVFTIGAFGTYEFEPNRALFITKITVAYPGAAAREFIGFGDDETTGINTIANSKQPIANSQVYNLAGQRVGKDYKGIVIVNGKKYIRK